jgi:hypothetical protein
LAGVDFVVFIIKLALLARYVHDSLVSFSSPVLSAPATLSDMTTTTTSAGHCLPAIPTLPPIQMPGDLDKNNYLDPEHDSIASPLSASSTVPQASFSSTSSSPVILRNPSLAAGVSGFSSPSSTDSAPQSLRKSISADSFVGYDRNTSLRVNGLRVDRGNTYSTAEVPRPRIQDSSMSPLRHEPIFSQPYMRSRGASVSTMSQSHDPSIEHRRESEPLQRLKRPSEVRRGSVKGKDHVRTGPRPGDLNLPPRTPAQARDDTLRLHTTSSLGSLPRARSGSVGLQTTAVSGRRLLIDTLPSSVSACQIQLTSNPDNTYPASTQRNCHRSSWIIWLRQVDIHLGGCQSARSTGRRGTICVT